MIRDVWDPFAIPEKEFMGMYRLPQYMAQALIQELEPYLPQRVRARAIPNHVKVNDK